MTGNQIGNEGTQLIIEVLKVNTTLKWLDLSCKKGKE